MQPLLPGLLDLLQRDLALRLERDVLGDLAAAAALGIIDPLVRHVKAIGHRQAGAMVGQRQRHGDLAIVLLAELAAVLPRDADRVPPFLRKTGIIDDPGLDRPVALDAG